MHLPQTKGVKSVVKIDQNKAAWIAALAGVGAAVIGSLALWPLMRRMLRNYDEQQQHQKNIEAGFADVEEDAFQKKVDAKLAAKEVDPNDKSVKAQMTRLR